LTPRSAYFGSGAIRAVRPMGRMILQIKAIFLWSAAKAHSRRRELVCSSFRQVEPSFHTPRNVLDPVSAPFVQADHIEQFIDPRPELVLGHVVRRRPVVDAPHEPRLASTLAIATSRVSSRRGLCCRCASKANAALLRDRQHHNGSCHQG
jgi:hypothetical protein